MPPPKRHEASPERQDEPARPTAPWTTLARRYAEGSRRPAHRHATAQLVFVAAGMLQVRTPQSQWTVLPQRALWLPPRQEHAIEALSAHAELRTVYFDPAWVDACCGAGAFARRAETHALECPALVRELVIALFDGRRAAATQARAAALLLHALGESACLPTRLPLPAAEPLRRAVLPLLSRRQGPCSLEDAAERAAMSPRNFTRRFAADTGMTFRAWRRQARLLASFDLLAGGRPVKAIAASLGFSSSSAYVAAFREAFGLTPEALRRGGAVPGKE